MRWERMWNSMWKRMQMVKKETDVRNRRRETVYRHFNPGTVLLSVPHSPPSHHTVPPTPSLPFLYVPCHSTSPGFPFHSFSREHLPPTYSLIFYLSVSLPSVGPAAHTFSPFFFSIHPFLNTLFSTPTLSSSPSHLLPPFSFSPFCTLFPLPLCTLGI